MSDALLRFENVTKSYGDFTVFSDISLEVHEKEVVSIIGSSGSGKTTLLRCINLLEPFEAGKIILDGQEIGYHDVNGKRKRVPEKGHRAAALDDGHGLPAVQPVPAHDGEEKRHARSDPHKENAEGRGRGAGGKSGSRPLAWATRWTTFRASSPAASSSVWPSHAPWP